MSIQLREKLHLLPMKEYAGVNRNDPIRFYFWPLLGGLYRRRAELCLNECVCGKRILEIGFGSGVTFINLSKRYEEIHGIDLTASTDIVAALYQGHHIQTFLQNGSVCAMPYADNYFDTILLVSILEHLKPQELASAFNEIRRVLKPGGQMIYGVPTDNPLMRLCFLFLGYNIRKHHFSSQRVIAEDASKKMTKVRIIQMKNILPWMGNVYEVGHFVKE